MNRFAHGLSLVALAVLGARGVQAQGVSGQLENEADALTAPDSSESHHRERVRELSDTAERRRRQAEAYDIAEAVPQDEDARWRRARRRERAQGVAARARAERDKHLMHADDLAARGIPDREETRKTYARNLRLLSALYGKSAAAKGACLIRLDGLQAELRQWGRTMRRAEEIELTRRALRAARGQGVQSVLYQAREEHERAQIARADAARHREAIDRQLQEPRPLPDDIESEALKRADRLADAAEHVRLAAEHERDAARLAAAGLTPSGDNREAVDQALRAAVQAAETEGERRIHELRDALRAARAACRPR